MVSGSIATRRPRTRLPSHVPAARTCGNNLFTSSTTLGYKVPSRRTEDGGMVEFTLGIGVAVFVHRWIRSAGLALGIPAVTVTVLAVLL